jgi:hypothetical protein
MMAEVTERREPPPTEASGAVVSEPSRKTRTAILSFASDIRFWILLCFLVRLIGITHPPLEAGHNWRQTLGTMVIRNFCETEANILHPRIDIGGDRAGITGMEFPLFNYLGYLVSCRFGYQHWYGRLINLIVSSLGLYMFYSLIRDHLKDQPLAFYSTIALLFSLWFSYSRKIMPDTFSMSLIITAVYFGCQYLSPQDKQHKSRWINLLLFGVMATAGMLTKLPSGYLLAILAVSLFKCRTETVRVISFLAVSAACLCVTWLWYGCWVPYLAAEYQVSHFYLGTGLTSGLRELTPHLPLVLKRFYETPLKYIGFSLSLFGLGWALVRKERSILTILLFCFPPFLAVILVSGYNFAHHAYYVIPYVPVMALLAGLGLKAIRPRSLLLFLLFAMCIEGIAARQNDFRIKAKHRALLSLETDLDGCSGRDELIAVNGSGSPTAIYFAHRKGWSLSNDEILNKPFIEDLQKRGLRFVVILNNAFGATPVTLSFPRVIEKEAYTIYTLSNQNTR